MNNATNQVTVSDLSPSLRARFAAKTASGVETIDRLILIVLSHGPADRYGIIRDVALVDNHHRLDLSAKDQEKVSRVARRLAILEDDGIIVRTSDSDPRLDVYRMA